MNQVEWLAVVSLIVLSISLFRIWMPVVRARPPKHIQEMYPQTSDAEAFKESAAASRRRRGLDS